ncbi:hypothetical protein QTP86_006915 [Hemibagrus guttatus]|nr:hypothetical protein QTP86_006915 [Hemibagrus guttatus]
MLCRRQKLKLCKPVVRTSKKWTSEAVGELQGCLDCTDWDVFRSTTNSLDEYTDTVSSYIYFCEDSIIPTCTRVSYNNDKPRFTAKLRRLRSEKEAAFRSGDKGKYKEAKYRFSEEVRRAKTEHGERMKQQFQTNDSASVWKGLKAITNYKPRAPHSVNDLRLANSLNEYYCLFERQWNSPVLNNLHNIQGHLIRNCPEKEATGNQETEMTKENNKESDQINDKQDSGEDSGNTKGQEKGKTLRRKQTRWRQKEKTPKFLSKRKSKTGNSGPQTRKKGLVEIEKENQVINGQELEIKSSSDHDTNAEMESDEDGRNSDGHTDLYKTDYSDNKELLDVFYRGLPKVSPEDNAVLEGPLVLEELQATLNSMAGGKAPRIDGLPAEFYKELGEDLLEVSMAGPGVGGLGFLTRRHGVKVMSSVNLEECCLAVGEVVGHESILSASRMNHAIVLFLSSVEKATENEPDENKPAGEEECAAGPAEAGADKHRYICDNVSLIRDILEVSKLLNYDIGLISLDQEKAFDRVEHLHPWKTLEAFGFCRDFINKIRVLYSDVESKLKVNGGLCTPFRVNRGLGCVDPPPHLLAEVQAVMVNFFWDKLHWVPQGVLYLPEEEGHLVRACPEKVKMDGATDRQAEQTRTKVSSDTEGDGPSVSVSPVAESVPADPPAAKPVAAATSMLDPVVTVPPAVETGAQRRKTLVLLWQNPRETKQEHLILQKVIKR